MYREVSTLKKSKVKKKNVTHFVQFRVTKSHMLDKIVQLVGSISALITHFGIRKGQNNVSQFVHKMPANLQNINHMRRLFTLIIDYIQNLHDLCSGL